jgi:hypothetical protein
MAQAHKLASMNLIDVHLHLQATTVPYEMHGAPDNLNNKPGYTLEANIQRRLPHSLATLPVAERVSSHLQEAQELWQLFSAADRRTSSMIIELRQNW